MLIALNYLMQIGDNKNQRYVCACHMQGHFHMAAFALWPLARVTTHGMATKPNKWLILTWQNQLPRSACSTSITLLINCTVSLLRCDCTTSCSSRQIFLEPIPHTLAAQGLEHFPGPLESNMSGSPFLSCHYAKHEIMPLFSGDCSRKIWLLHGGRATEHNCLGLALGTGVYLLDTFFKCWQQLTQISPVKDDGMGALAAGLNKGCSCAKRYKSYKKPWGCIGII